jgi:hypothetical protein
VPVATVDRSYTSPVLDTTIKVTTQTRDRLAILAAEADTTVKDLVAELARTRLSRAELAARGDLAFAYIRSNLRADFTEADRVAGRQLLVDLAAGRVTELGDAPLPAAPPALPAPPARRGRD